jgi:hypothetical protein
VVVLGDLASPRVRGPLIVPWSNGLGIAPVGLQRTVALSLGLETGRRVPQAGVGSQFARLAVPLTTSEQGEVAVHGLPAVLLTVAGERGPGGAQAVSQDRLQEMGRSALRTIAALDGRDEPIPGPRAELFISRKLVPGWAIRLVVGALILPALIAAVDGFARVRRRREPVARWLAWTLAGAPSSSPGCSRSSSSSPACCPWRRRRRSRPGSSRSTGRASRRWSRWRWSSSWDGWRSVPSRRAWRARRPRPTRPAPAPPCS